MSGFAASGSGGMVASADALATDVGVRVLRRGGNGVDAAIAASAAMAVVGPHLCGMGGDLFALVHHRGQVSALNSSGRAGLGASAAGLRAEGLQAVPLRHDVRAVTVPGCVDGWVALHARFGSLPLTDLLGPAHALAEGGFPASPLLVHAARQLDEAGRRNLAAVADQATASPGTVRLPGVARTLAAIATDGRHGFYEGEFGAGLRELGAGQFTAHDLAHCQADWVEPLSADAFGVTLHTTPPNSQGYLTLGGARLATALDLPDDPDDPQWAHLLIECAKQAGYDRPDMLAENADGAALLAAIDARLATIDPSRAVPAGIRGSTGDTTCVCTVDASGTGVSLIASNASGFGSWLAEPHTGINLHNRGLGFSLVADHPAELAPGRRPPHTLSPALATRDSRLAAVFGTMGGDAQPQILLQIVARLFHHAQPPEVAIPAGRWALAGPETGFDTWAPGASAPDSDRLTVIVEGHAPTNWPDALRARGHRAESTRSFDGGFGHAHAIVAQPDGGWAGAADPRTAVGAAASVHQDR